MIVDHKIQAQEPVIEAGEYLSEAEVVRRWPMITRAELRRARKATPPQISFYDFEPRKGGPHYTAIQIQQYIDSKYKRVAQCKSPDLAPSQTDSKSASSISISPSPIEEPSGTSAGMTPELARLAAEALAQQISKRPRSSSRRSSPQPPKKQRKAPLTLVK